MVSSPPEMISIKRYPNRRLYDRQARRYITLQDIENMVLQGKQLEVRDSKTGEDLTRVILTQILLERHPEKMEMFPVAMLHGILRANDLVLEFVRSYLKQSLTVLENLQHSTPLSPFMAPMDWMRAMLPGTFPVSAGRSQSPAEPSPTLENLASRISAIEERIQRLESTEKDVRAADLPVPTLVGASAKDENAALDRLEQRLRSLESQTAGRSRSSGKATGQM